ncbi:MAG: DUF1549 domain-containing protein, partial [Planctomycetes bacterium]|nr:DUF1549 domain-containing protein [Planctomycetota bacterium]
TPVAHALFYTVAASLLVIVGTRAADAVTDPDPMKTHGAPGFPLRNAIDSYVLAKINDAKLAPSRKCTDDEFVRRAYLDVIGVIPSPEAVKLYLTDPRSDKRERLIDSLLANERYGAHWAIIWGDLLREHSQTRQEEGSYPGSYRNWVRDALNANMPYDKFMTTLVTSSGRADQSGAVNFYLRDGNNRVETANSISSAFMGTRMACAQCHDHPFDKWEQKDFHSLMAFIAPRVNVRTDDQSEGLLKERDAWDAAKEKETGVKPDLREGNGGRRRKGGEQAGDPKGGDKPADKGGADPHAKAAELVKQMRAAVATLGQDKTERFNQFFGNMRVNLVRENGGGDYHMPAEGDGSVNGKGADLVEPIFPWDPSKKAEGGSRRESLAKFIAGHPQFALVQANRLWAALMGRGLVEPLDDFRPKNPATHPELLKFLADELVNAKFDSKHVLRLILNSSAYDRSSKPETANKDDKTLFSHRQLRRMTAEQLFDSILVATGQADPKVSMVQEVKAPDLKKPEVPPSRAMSGSGLSSSTGSAASTPPPGPAKESGSTGGSMGGNMGGGMMGMMGPAGNDSGMWAFDQPTPANLGSFMNSFNQPSREEFHATRDASATITQALELFNGRPINDAVKKDKNMFVQGLIDKKLNIVQIVQELYLATLSRLPTGMEQQVAVGYVGSNARNKLEDLHWALMNTREFMFIK